MNINGLYNNAGALFADNNSFKGIDIVRFGKSLNEITNRVTLENVSILTQFQKVIEIYDLYYVVEVIEGFERKRKELIPRNAFREAVANALVHRLWDVNANIKISMFDDKIEISSPGGLVNDLSKEDYMRGGLSILRNPIIGNIFYRLNYIEKFGTGIRKINASYENSLFKPSYVITDTTISIILPLISNDLHLNLNEQKVINSFKGVNVLARKQIEELTGLSKSQVIRVLNSLREKQLVSTSGAGPGLKYHLV